MMLRAALVAATVGMAGALVPLVMKHAQSASITFDDSASDRLVLSAPDYRVTLNKTNGAFLGIEDAQSGAVLSQGSNGGCLWGAVFAGSAGYIGGCSFGVKAAKDFSYVWHADTATLTLQYTGNTRAAQYVNATVTITATSSPYFDMRLSLQNHAGSTLRNAIFPSELLFKTSAVQGGYLPYYLPGVRVKPAFFSADHANVPTYPGGTAFADYLSLDIAGSHVALYSVNPAPNRIQPVALGFIHNAANNVCQGDSFCTEHSFQTSVADGESWTSPPVRVVIGQSTASTALSYRHDNGIDAYPSVADKLGAHFSQYARSPLIKADAAAVSLPFRSWIPVLSGLPSPALLHPVAYMLGGHDHSYPDFLPPDPTWGSTKDFAAMVQGAHAKGLLVMPYTNPTWWTDDSKTIKHLPAPVTLQDISVLDENKTPVHEAYGPNGGYDVSPYNAFVQKRIAEEMGQWQTAVPVDCVFEDQIGARAWMRDLNPSSPSPVAYSQGWLDHTERYKQQCLMTENGWDRLAATEIGFNGSILTWERAFNDPDQAFGAGAWEGLAVPARSGP
ncbi:MAG: DUF6259 domain-containing protein [Chloroflexi bacterium]|nr:DUF6259 domain-containing protein [Chloroflexota bacterium]